MLVIHNTEKKGKAKRVLGKQGHGLHIFKSFSVPGKWFSTLPIYSLVKTLLENINPCSLSRMLKIHLGGEHREPSSKEERQWLLQHSHLFHKQPNLRDSGQECQQHSCMMHESRKRKIPIFKDCEGAGKSSL